MPGTISGSVTLKNVRVGFGPEVHRRVLQRPVESAHSGPHGHRDEADLERDVRNQDRGVSRCPAEVEEQSQQRRAKHDLRGRQRKHKEGVHGALPRNRWRTRAMATKVPNTRAIAVDTAATLRLSFSASARAGYLNGCAQLLRVKPCHV